MQERALDIIVFEGREFPVGEALLETYFEKHRGQRPGGPARSYWATYGFNLEDTLYVRDVEIADARNLRTGRRSIIDSVFAEPDDKELRFFSGLLLLSIDKGKNVILVEVRRGNKRGVRRYDAAGLADFKRGQFDYFCLTDDYEALRAAAQKEFELKEQEARRKDAGRGYRSFDEKTFNETIARDILVHAKEFLAD